MKKKPKNGTGKIMANSKSNMTRMWYTFFIKKYFGDNYCFKIKVNINEYSMFIHLRTT